MTFHDGTNRRTDDKSFNYKFLSLRQMTRDDVVIWDHQNKFGAFSHVVRSELLMWSHFNFERINNQNRTSPAPSGEKLPKWIVSAKWPPRSMDIVPRLVPSEEPLDPQLLQGSSTVCSAWIYHSKPTKACFTSFSAPNLTS